MFAVILSFKKIIASLGGRSPQDPTLNPINCAHWLGIGLIIGTAFSASIIPISVRAAAPPQVGFLLPAWPITDVGDAIPNEMIAVWRGYGNNGNTCNALPKQFDSFPTKYPNPKSALDTDELPFDPDQVCNDGDATTFNGLLCASGEMVGCRAVAEAQGLSGRWYRSPHRRWMWANRCFSATFPEALFSDDCANSFTSDPGLAVMLYTLATHDTDHYRLWLNWINDNATTTNICKWNGGKVSDCFSTNWPRYADYDLGFTPPDFPVFGFTLGNSALHPWDTFDFSAVNSALGIEYPPHLSEYDLQARAMMAVLLASANAAAIPVAGIPPLILMSSVDKAYYPLHLDAIRVLIRMMIADPGLQRDTLPTLPDPNNLDAIASGLLASDASDPEVINAAASIITLKAGCITLKAGWNPFYHLLSDGPSKKVRQMIIDRCPKVGSPPNQIQRFWLWEEDGTSVNGIPDNDPSYSMGWDCVFLAQLYNKMRVPKSLRDQLVDEFTRYVATIGQSLNLAQKGLAAERLNNAADLKAVATTKQALDSAENFVNNQYAILRKQALDNLNGLTNQLGNQAAQLSQLQAKSGSLISQANALPITIETRVASTVCNALGPLKQLCKTVYSWSSAPDVARQNLLNQAANINAQIANLQTNGIDVTKKQIIAATNDIADLDAKFQSLSQQLAGQSLQTAFATATAQLKLESTVLQSAQITVNQAQYVNTRATNRLEVWLKTS